MAPSVRCPECASDNTRWLEEVSRAAAVEYFRCDACAAVWVVGRDPHSTHEVTIRGASHPVTDFFDVGLKFLIADLESGMLFAGMACGAFDVERRRALRAKARQAYEDVSRHLPKISLSSENRARVVGKLKALGKAIEDIPP